MSSLRSEDMTLCSLYLLAETAYSTVAELGEMGIVHFRDLNKNMQAFQRKFVSEIRRCDEAERQLRYFEREVRLAKMDIYKLDTVPEAPAPKQLVDLEAMFERMETELKEHTKSLEALKFNRSELIELRHVLEKTEIFFLEVPSGVEISTVTPEGVPLMPDQRSNVGYVAGILHQERLAGFMRLLWFACHGNVLIRHIPIDEAHDNEPRERKVVFVVFFQGEQLKLKVKKICDGFRATLYPCPESPSERREMINGLNQRLSDLHEVIDRSEEQRQNVILTLSKNLDSWFVKIRKVKAIYHVLNMMHSEGQNFVGECWVPMSDIGNIQIILNKACEGTGYAPSLLHPVTTDEPLPTFYRTNKFTSAFQHIVDAYGYSTYKEVNPALFGVITFPFLFAVMFGDLGHGILILLFALWMIAKEKSLSVTAAQEEMFGILFGGRYLIMLMGFFSIYSGIIYNDTFSKPMNLFGSVWHVVYDAQTLNSSTSRMLDPNNTAVYTHDKPYPFGLDPVWPMSENKITFTNSFKEKISVIFGISQMLLGVILSIFNHIHFKEKINIICEFIPQVLFLLSIFGYLVLLIVAKWIIYTPDKSGEAPSLLIGFINMFLMNYAPNNGSPVWYPGQKTVQMSLVAIAFISAMWMLLLKPIIIKCRQRRPQHYSPLVESINSDEDPHDNNITSNVSSINGAQTSQSAKGSTSHQQHGHGEDDFSEVCIHQAIHTIEFCLGCVSHTASYLRLWALSLAHSQLSEVLWSMVLRIGFQLNKQYIGGVFIAAVFLPFACLTVAILLFMEGLSAFLHTLRLHWVEFQSKFYKGEGFPFQPFSFREILQRTE